ncbi:hypothetical protein [Deinococcus ruber]|uniref:Uncharacterized protein n=1 Tax=Deinococcus ruber TaxID=1848197 RepID=A0A918F793_9DEIO|nr:hypothetical protein [Deinococcus ruber]GGR07118.1 hypothetical protein GCM10008957_19670 [Deinococcus ruber]
MEHWLGKWGLLLALGGSAQAALYTLKIDDRSTSIDGTPDSGGLYVSLLPLLQALGGGMRPATFSSPAATVNVSFRLVGSQPYLDAVRA